MGRKGSRFSSVKKVLSLDPKEKADKKAKKKWFGKEKHTLPDSSTAVIATVSPPRPVTVLPVEEIKLEEVEEEQKKHVYSVAVAVATAAVATAAVAVAAAHADAEVVRLTTVNQFSGKSQEEVAAIRIQTAFRGYLARRAFGGLVRLKSLVDGPTSKRQTANAVKCMQTLSRVQSQISCRRIRMLEENQRQLMQKHAKELESSRRGEKWDDSLQSKEQIEASLLRKYEAATRRERALAYSYYHQQTWKKSSRSTNLLFLDPTNPQWTGARPWESQSMSEKGLKTDQMCVRSVSIAGGEIAKSFARHQLNSELPSSPSSQKSSHPSGYNSPTTPSKSATSVAAARKLKPASPRVNAMNQDEDVRSMQSEQNRRHSIASSPSVPSYMASTQSAKAKTRSQSPLGMGNGTSEKGSAGPVKKLPSYASSLAMPRRHSRPPWRFPA